MPQTDPILVVEAVSHTGPLALYYGYTFNTSTWQSSCGFSRPIRAG
jgi:hypothetical protein